jgi:phage terminase Nu1 subunit (DNA packaging protein)
MAGEIDLNKFVDYWESKGLKMKARRYRQIADEGRVPKVVKGKILDPMATMTALACYYQKLAEGNGSLSLTDERTRLTRINADKKELELEKARGELIDTAFAQKMWGGVLENIVKKIDIIPSKLPPLAYGLSIPEIKAVTERMIFEVKNEMSNPDLEQIARNTSNKGIAKFGPSSVAPKRKRLGGRKPDAKPRGKRGTGEVVHVEG